jgi:hypothetical protein
MAGEWKLEKASIGKGMQVLHICETSPGFRYIFTDFSGYLTTRCDYCRTNMPRKLKKKATFLYHLTRLKYGE